MMAARRMLRFTVRSGIAVALLLPLASCSGALDSVVPDDDDEDEQDPDDHDRTGFRAPPGGVHFTTVRPGGTEAERPHLT